ncbi:MAG: glycosyltransferase [Kiritimatiellales bacterium]
MVPKLQIIRHPSAPDVLETDVSNLLEKEKNIVAVGRWWAHQKNTPLLIAVLVEALKANQEYEAHLIGSGSEVLIRLLGDAPVAVRNRIYIHGPIVHPEVVDFFKKSRICLLTSRYESGPLVASEALCCGCSFFAQDNGGVPLKAIRRIDAGGGVDGNVRKLVRGLLQEMERWDRGEYDPTRIAELAREVFSYKQVASEVQSFFMDGN